MTRVLYTEADLAARAYIKELCEDAGLAVREDAIGNMFARWEGQRPDLAAVGTGSHIDAIPHSGRFDGTVGVLGGLAAIRTLRHVGFEPVRPIELVMFTSEEPTRFGIGCLGSRALCREPVGRGDDGAAKTRTGRPFDEVRQAAGFHGELANVQLPAGYFAAFVELHIEQGPVLERAGLPIGIVTAIAAPAALRVTWNGEGGHAGAVLMPGRRDALCAAAEAVLAVEAAALSQRQPRHRRDHGRLPRPSRGDQQHPRPGHPRDRRPRHRPRPPRPRARGDPRGHRCDRRAAAGRGRGRMPERRPARQNLGRRRRRRSRPRAATWA